MGVKDISGSPRGMRGAGVGGRVKSNWYSPPPFNAKASLFASFSTLPSAGPTDGIFLASMQAPTRLAAQSLGRSVDSPSERSIMEVAKRFFASHCPRANRGSGERCFLIEGLA